MEDDKQSVTKEANELWRLFWDRCKDGEKPDAWWAETLELFKDHIGNAKTPFASKFLSEVALAYLDVIEWVAGGRKKKPNRTVYGVFDADAEAIIRAAAPGTTIKIYSGNEIKIYRVT